MKHYKTNTAKLIIKLYIYNSSSIIFIPFIIFIFLLTHLNTSKKEVILCPIQYQIKDFLFKRLNNIFK